MAVNELSLGAVHEAHPVPPAGAVKWNLSLRKEHSALLRSAAAIDASSRSPTLVADDCSAGSENPYLEESRSGRERAEGKAVDRASRKPKMKETPKCQAKAALLKR